ncbi:MAG: hypothetical protein WD379_01325 [Dehalococcoidia bacterium]
MKRDLIAGVALAALVVLAVVVAIREFGGGSDAESGYVCDIGLGTVRIQLDAEAFARGDERLTALQERAAIGDFDGVWSSFYPFAHALTHDVNFRLRSEGHRGLADDLCEEVLAFEVDIVVPERDFEQMAARAEAIRGLLDEARRELGFGAG